MLNHLRWRRCLAIGLLGLMTLGWAAAAAAQEEKRPAAPQLLPADTLAYFRIADTPELIEKWQETTFGRMFNDPQIRPLVDQLYGEAADAFDQFQDQVGASLNQLLSIPQGEFCIAMVKPEEGPPAVVALLDVKSSKPVAEKLLARGEELLATSGATRSTETVGGTELIIHKTAGETPREVVYFHREEVIVITSNLGTAKHILAAWDGEKDADGKALRTLADNPKFTAIMKQCLGAQGERPQVTFFVDPIEIVKVVSRGTVAGQTVLALLPPLGLTGVRGIGGSAIFSTEDFDSVVHLHLLLANPRSGVLEMLAMTNGDTTPEAWVPADAASYATVNWDIAKTHESLTKVYDSIRGEGALARDLDQYVSQNLGVDFATDVIPALDGRVTLVGWMEKPARLNSQANLIALRLKDAEAFQKTLDKVAEKFAADLTKESFSGVDFLRSARPLGPQPQEGQENQGPRLLRQSEPAIAIIDDYLVLADSTNFMKEVISAKLGRVKSLAGELDYKLIASKIKRQMGDNQAGMISFNRPEQGMKSLFEFATADDVRERLASGAENNGFFRVLNTALTDHPLPEFSVIQQYMAPTGGLMTNDETGMHYMAFSLKRSK